MTREEKATEANRKLLERYVELYNAGDLDACMDLLVDEGDKFADEWTFTGTNTGPFRLPDGTEVPATGKRVEIKGMELVEVRDGKIVVDNLYYDFMAALVQLGLVPQGAAA